MTVGQSVTWIGGNDEWPPIFSYSVLGDVISSVLAVSGFSRPIHFDIPTSRRNADVSKISERPVSAGQSGFYLD